MARLHYRHLGTTTHFMCHTSFMICCCWKLLGILSFVPSDLASQLSTETRTILASSILVQYNFNTRCPSLHLLHQIFVPFSISNASHMQFRSISMGFSLHGHYFIVNNFVARVKYSVMCIIYVVVVCVLT